MWYVDDFFGVVDSQFADQYFDMIEELHSLLKMELRPQKVIRPSKAVDILGHIANVTGCLDLEFTVCPRKALASLNMILDAQNTGLLSREN